MVSPDKPFRLKQRGTESLSLFSRIEAIKRVEFLTKVSLLQTDRDWNGQFLWWVDIEMYKRWYKGKGVEPVIDEEFCQRMAKVVKDLLRDKEDIKASGVDAGQEVKKMYQAEQQNLAIQPPAKAVETNVIKRGVKWVQNWVNYLTHKRNC